MRNNNSKVVAIIPARAGSKRLPNKNMKEFLGRPLIQWTIDAAVESSIFDEVYVSTDDPLIIELCGDIGVTVLKRPALLATDHSSTADVIMDILNKVSNVNCVSVLQPTSPLRKAEAIRGAYEQFVSSNASSLASVFESRTHPNWSSCLTREGVLEGLPSPNCINLRSQDLEKVYSLNGAIYFCDVKVFKERGYLVDNSTYGYVMGLKESVDIDTIDDFKLAEFYAREITGLV